MLQKDLHNVWLVEVGSPDEGAVAILVRLVDVRLGVLQQLLNHLQEVEN